MLKALITVKQIHGHFFAKVETSTKFCFVASRRPYRTVLSLYLTIDPFDADLNLKKRKIDDPRYYYINTSLSLTFLAKHITLASIFPSKSGLEKPNLP